jgi:type I restriction enzyme S subunit
METKKRDWETVKLGEVLKPSENTVSVTPMELYPQVGIRLWGGGAYAREPVLGSQTQYKFFYKAQIGDLTFNKIWARNGAVAVINESLNGYYVTPEFPVYHLQEKVIIPEWLDFLTKAKFFWESCNEKAFGTSGKNRVKPSEFLQIEIPLPPLSEQQRIAGRLAALKGKIDAVRVLRGEQEKEMKGLLLMQYQKIIAGAEWKPMKEVAPIIRRDVQISENGSYPELGIRSFGKGTFHKPALTGLEVGTKRLFRIETGDLMFSNVFAWEGAIAVAKKEDDGRFGSHRFISCVCKEDVALPEFLCFHFLTRKGMEDINAASPGGAGRNKTLGLTKLEKTLVPVPGIRLQKEFLQLQTKMDALKAAQAGQLSALEGLFPGVLEQAFRGEW